VGFGGPPAALGWAGDVGPAELVQEMVRNCHVDGSVESCSPKFESRILGSLKSFSAVRIPKISPTRPKLG
jgi:hypothetical protein